MTNPFEDISNSKKSSINSENEAVAQKLRRLHDVFLGVNKYVRPIIEQFSQAIGAYHFNYVIDDNQIPRGIDSLTLIEQIKLLSNEKPLWVVTNKKRFISPDYCDGVGDRIILVYWNEDESVFSVTYHKGVEGKTVWAGDKYLGTSDYWDAGVRRQTKTSEAQDLIDVLHDLYRQQKEDIDHYFRN